jgi:hypothetical protein
MACSSAEAGAPPADRVALWGASSSVMAMSATRLTSASAPASFAGVSGPARWIAITTPAITAAATTIASAQRAQIGGGRTALRCELIG